MKLLRPILLLAGTLLSCQIILGLDEPTGNQPGATLPDAAESGSAPKDPCSHQLAPGPPATDDDPETKQSFWLATIRLDAPLRAAAGVKPGFDLDNSCTCAPDLFDGGPTCITPKTTSCDYDGGVDDAFGLITSQFSGSSIGAFDAMKPVNRLVEDGIRNLLFYVKNYNGKANDSDVGVAIIGSGGLYTNKGCKDEERANAITFLGPDEDSPGTRYAPLNDGCDRWSPADGTTIGKYPDRLPVAASAAYVTNYDLVFPYKEAAAAIFGGATKLANGVIVAHLSKDENGKFRATGVLAGRIAFGDLLDLIGRTPVDNTTDGGKQAFCTTSYWPLVSQKFCDARDVMLSPSEERLGKVCDATSTAFGFSLVQAQVSDVIFTNLQKTSECPSSAVPCP